MTRDKDEENQEDTRNFAVAAIKALRKIGYQCRLTLLDSRSFGSPQNRLRLFLVCARNGIPLPSNPEPTHANPVLTVNFFVAGEADGRTPRPFYVGPKGAPGSAPYPPVTVREAISDLPAFEYQHQSGERALSTARLGGAGMPKFLASGQPGDRIGFTRPVAYRTPPHNDYQARQRGRTTEVADHYTPTRSNRVLDMYVCLIQYALER